MVAPVAAAGAAANPALVRQLTSGLQSAGLGSTDIDSLLRLGQAGGADQYVQGAGGMQVNLNAQPSPGTNPSTASPSSAVQSVGGRARGSFSPSYVPLSQAGEIQFQGRQLTGSHLSASLDKGLSSGNPNKVARTQRFMAQHDIRQGADGSFMMGVQSGPGQLASAAGGQSAGGGTPGAILSQATGGQGAAASTGNFLTRNSWVLPAMGFMTGGIGGLVGGMVMGRALSGTAGGLGAAGSVLNGGAANIAGGAGWGTASIAAQVAGLPGLAMNMRHIMQSHAREHKLNTMISNINNPGIPIEDLIFMFMAQMGENYEQKLRQKMEEAAMAEKKEEQRSRSEATGRMLGGLASAIPGVGPAIGAAVEAGVAEKNRIHQALDGNSKSSTILMQEVQMLMHKWKQLNELLSNLMKAMHDMAMTPIRNAK